MGMQHHYDWRFSVPTEHLRGHMDVLDAIDATPQPPAQQARRFDATLVLQRQPLTAGTLARTLLGVEGLFNAAVIVVAIAAGVAFGNTLAKPITDRMGTLLPTELVMHQRG